MGLLYLAHRERLAEGRFEGAVPHEFQCLLGLAGGGHRRPDDLQLVPEDAVEVRLRAAPGRRAAGDDPPPFHEALQRVAPGVGTDVVDDHVDPAVVGQVPNLAGEVGLRVVDGVVGPEFLGIREFLVGARRREHLRAGVVGHLNGGVADAARGAEDEDRLAALQSAAVAEHPPGRLEDERCGRGGLPVDALGDRREVGRRDDGLLGVDSADVLADDVKVRSQRGVTLAAELVVTSALTSEQCDPVTGFEPRDVVADLRDDARAVAPRDVGHLEVDARQPAPGVDVEVVQRGCFHVYQHLSPATLRVRELVVGEYVSVAVGVELDCLHCLSPRGKPLRNHCGDGSTAG